MTPDEGSIRVELPAGAVDVDAVWTRVDGATAGYVLTHGAGSRCDRPFLVELCAALATQGVSALRVDLP